MTKKLLLYAKLKEVRSAWVFFVLAFVSSITLWIRLPEFIALLFTLAFTGFFIYLFIAGIAMAKTNFSLKIEKNQNAAIIAGFSEGVIAYDQFFRVISMNSVAEMITGLRKEEIIGQIVGPEWAGAPRYKILAQIIFPSLASSVVKKTLGGWPQRVAITIKDPQELHLEIATNQIFDESGKLIGFIKVVRDRSRELALVRSKSEFIAVAAHQMRTPLTGIRWALDSLKSDAAERNQQMAAQSEDQKALLAQTSTSVEKLIKLIDDLLNVAKIEEGKFGYVMKKDDLTALVRSVLETLAQAAEARGVRLVFYPPAEELGPILMDKSKLALALQNIIENGIRYNVKNGEVRVKFEKLPGKPYIKLTVQDTGIGMRESEVARLFKKFFRGEAAVRAEPEGSGLGLYIARNIIARHGGEITASSVEKRGTTFTILLPTDESLVPPTEMATEEVF